MKKTHVPTHLLCRLAVGLISGLAVGLVGADAALAAEKEPPPSDPVQAVAMDYLETLYRFDFDSLSELASPDLILEDPTAAFTTGEPLRLEGLAAVVDVFRSFAETVDSVELKIEHTFTSGDHVVAYLEFVTVGDGAFAGRPGVQISLRVPVVTVLRVQDGRVTHHLDHADYESMLRQATGAESGSAEPGSEPSQDADGVRTAALRYLETLYRFDFESLVGSTSEDLAFADPTSTYFGGKAWSRRDRDEVFGFFAASSEGIESAGFDLVSSFTSGEYAVLWLRYRTTGDGALLGAPGLRVSLEIPGATVIRVRDGQVIEHLDHVDYQSMMAQVEAQKAAARGSTV